VIWIFVIVFRHAGKGSGWGYVLNTKKVRGGMVLIKELNLGGLDVVWREMGMDFGEDLGVFWENQQI